MATCSARAQTMAPRLQAPRGALRATIALHSIVSPVDAPRPDLCSCYGARHRREPPGFHAARTHAEWGIPDRPTGCSSKLLLTGIRRSIKIVLRQQFCAHIMPQFPII